MVTLVNLSEGYIIFPVIQIMCMSYTKFKITCVKVRGIHMQTFEKLALIRALVGVKKKNYIFRFHSNKGDHNLFVLELENNSLENAQIDSTACECVYGHSQIGKKYFSTHFILRINFHSIFLL